VVSAASLEITLHVSTTGPNTAKRDLHGRERDAILEHS
jgi:hypothetical protein